MSQAAHIEITYDATPEAQPEAIVVYCSAPRFQTAFSQFIEAELGLRPGQFIPLVVAGGAGVLARPQRRPKEFKFMRDRFELFCRHYPSVKRVVLINHEDCAYYRMLADRIPGFACASVGAPAHRPREDLELIAEVSRRFLSPLGLAVELYYARFANEDHSKVTFESLLMAVRSERPSHPGPV